MRKIVSFLIIGSVVISFIGCGNEGSTQDSVENIKVSVLLPESSSQQASDAKQYKSFQSDVNSILLQVFQVTPEEKLTTRAMTKDANGAWSIDLILDPSSAPFRFNAMAYVEVVSPETESSHIPVFTGVSEDVANGAEAVIVLSETEDSRNASFRSLPRLASVGQTINDDETVTLAFNLTNTVSETLTYTLSAIADSGEGTACDSSLFTAATGSAVASFVSQLTLDEVNCANPKYFLTLTNSINDTVQSVFEIDLVTRTTSIALPPVIENLNVIDNQTSFDMNVVVTDSASLDLSYAWNITQGTATLDSTTTQAVNVSGFNNDNNLSIAFTVTNNITGTSASIGYDLIIENFITFAELQTMIRND